jgi:cytochrome bd-type quinol oxidase subunit 1
MMYYGLFLNDLSTITHRVQVLKNIAQGFQITSSQIMFTTLSVFLLGVTLIIYGLRLTLRAPRQTSIYLKAMMCALISPVIVIITAYQLGIALRAPLEIHAKWEEKEEEEQQQQKHITHDSKQRTLSDFLSYTL